METFDAARRGSPRRTGRLACATIILLIFLGRSSSPINASSTRIGLTHRRVLHAKARPCCRGSPSADDAAGACRLNIILRASRAVDMLADPLRCGLPQATD